MRKLLVLLFVVSFIPSAMAGNSFSLRLSFTIPQTIEVKPGCFNEAQQEKQDTQAAQEDENAIASTMTTTENIVRGGQTCLVQTVMAK